MDNRDWRYQPLTWSLLRTHFGAWFLRHRLAISIALGTAVLTWGVCEEIAQHGNVQVPAAAQIVKITEYAQAYDIYKYGSELMLSRVRNDGVVEIAMTVFGVTWWIVYLIQEYRSRKNQRNPWGRFDVLVQGFFSLLFVAFLFAETLPSIQILFQPQLIILDPKNDLVTLNGAPLGRMSAISEFEGIHKEGYRYDWTWFGVKLKDGRYYPFTEGSLIGTNVELIAPYLNQYLKQNPPDQAAALSH